jgi:hypothetical protein
VRVVSLSSSGLPLLSTELSCWNRMNSGHDGSMEHVSGRTSFSRRRRHGPTVAREAADSRAAALAPTIRKLMAEGFVSQSNLMGELNRRGIPSPRGGRWHRTSIARVLIRLGFVTSARGNNVRALKRAAEVRAEALGPGLLKLRKAGFSVEAIARELNQRRIPTPRAGKWHKTSVLRLLQRLENLDQPSNRLS